MGRSWRVLGIGDHVPDPHSLVGFGRLPVCSGLLELHVLVVEPAVVVHGHAGEGQSGRAGILLWGLSWGTEARPRPRTVFRTLRLQLRDRRVPESRAI